MSGFVAVGYFLFSLLFGFLIFILWARIALRYIRLSALHPISQSVFAITNPLVLPFSYVLRSHPTRLSRYDGPGICALIVIEMLKFITIGLLQFGTVLPWSIILLYTAAELITQPCNLLFYAILIRVIMSWINPMWRGPIADILRLITDPLLYLGRRFIPDIAGLDFSPLIVMVCLQVIMLFISASLPMHL